jgi:hypothetical protein
MVAHRCDSLAGLGASSASRAGQGRLVGGPAAQAAQGRLGGLDVDQLVEDLGQALVALLEAEPVGVAGQAAGGLLGGAERGSLGVLGGDGGVRPAGQLGTPVPACNPANARPG